MDKEYTNLLNATSNETSLNLNEVYVLWVEGKGNPTMIHTNAKQAQDEAARLARKEGKRVHFLETTLIFEVMPSPLKISRVYTKDGLIYTEPI